MSNNEFEFIDHKAYEIEKQATKPSALVSNITVSREEAN